MRMRIYSNTSFKMAALILSRNYSRSAGILACAPPSGERQRAANVSRRPPPLVADLLTVHYHNGFE